MANNHQPTYSHTQKHTNTHIQLPAQFASAQLVHATVSRGDKARRDWKGGLSWSFGAGCQQPEKKKFKPKPASIGNRGVFRPVQGQNISTMTTVVCNNPPPPPSSRRISWSWRSHKRRNSESALPAFNQSTNGRASLSAIDNQDASVTRNDAVGSLATDFRNPGEKTVSVTAVVVGRGTLKEGEREAPRNNNRRSTSR